jgi:hypothetical protein
MEKERSRFPLLLAYRFCLYKRDENDPLLEAELRWPDHSKNRRNYSRRFFGLKEDYLRCYREHPDNGMVLQPMRRQLLLSDPTKDFEEVVWKWLVHHLKDQQEEEEWYQTAQTLLRLQHAIRHGPIPPETAQKIRLKVSHLRKHKDYMVRNNADWVLNTLSERLAE